MRKFLVIGAVAVVALAASAAAAFGVANAQSGSTVYTRGDEEVQPNVFIRADLRFSPGPAVVESGGTLTWEHADQTDAPHTVTIVDQDELPTDFIEVLEGCAAGVCGEAFNGHVGAVLHPVLDNFVPTTEAPVFDGRGDSVLFFHGQSFTATIEAPSGSTLYYLCAVHPWMQGSIKVN